MDHQALSELHHRLLHGKLANDILWTDVVTLIGHLGKVEPQGQPHDFAFVVGEQREVFEQPHTHGVLAVATVSRLRKFLKAAGREAPT